MTKKLVRTTMADAIVRYLCAQRIVLEDGQDAPLFAGIFAIFGHGNVTCLGQALDGARESLPTWRGQNEQSMALAAIAFAKAKRRRQMMAVTTSIGPGATNLVTAAALAHANRLPVLLLGGDVFANRRPDPVLQQVEHFGDPTVTVNDAFRAVTRFWDRITHPEQILTSLPRAMATLLDPAVCGPAFIGLCQDIQEQVIDYPAHFFAPCLHRIPRARPDTHALDEAARLVRGAKRPLVIAGGGVHYALALSCLSDMVRRRGFPVAETIAGKGVLTHDHPAHVGPIGVIGSASANEIAAEADVVLAIGTRLQDFSTGSRSLFANDVQFVSINTARHDAIKHGSHAVVGDARESLIALDAALGDQKADAEWVARGASAFARWNALLDDVQRPVQDQTLTYAHVVGTINRLARPDELVVSSAGGLPGEVTKGWRVKNPGTFDCEFGYSCMGYEIAGGWGAAMADPDRLPIVLVGDGSYLMMNTDIYSSVLSGHKMIVIVCDNGGFAVINRLQTAMGGRPFNNLIDDCKVKQPFHVDFALHAASMGAASRRADSASELEEAFQWARDQDRTTVVVVRTDAHTWVPGDAWWDVGIPEESAHEAVRSARQKHEAGRVRQRRGI